MNPKQAIETLKHLIDNQKTVVTRKLTEPMEVLENQYRFMKKENDKLRNKVKRQQNALRRLNNK